MSMLHRCRSADRRFQTGKPPWDPWYQPTRHDPGMKYSCRCPLLAPSGQSAQTCRIRKGLWFFPMAIYKFCTLTRNKNNAYSITCVVMRRHAICDNLINACQIHLQYQPLPWIRCCKWSKLELELRSWPKDRWCLSVFPAQNYNFF